MNTDTVKLVFNTAELDRIAAGLGRNRDTILNALAFEIERLAKQLCPKDTGALANSIYTRGKRESTSPGDTVGRPHEEIPAPGGDVVAVVGSGMEYAAYVELGTSRMGDQPYLGPAVEHNAHKLNTGELWRRLFEK